VAGLGRRWWQRGGQQGSRQAGKSVRLSRRVRGGQTEVAEKVFDDALRRRLLAGLLVLVGQWRVVGAPSREGRGRISSRRSGDGDGAHAVDVGLGGRAETTVELGSGQSFAIAGLLQKTTVDQTNALPGIGEMPVIGALFKSNNFQRGGVGAGHHCHAVSGAAGA
jgi:hypothetical protein